MVELPVQLALVAVDVVDQPGHRRVHAHRVGAAVHAVFQRQAQAHKTKAPHVAHHRLRLQRRVPGQGGKPHRVAQTLAVPAAKEPVFDHQPARFIQTAPLQKGVELAVFHGQLGAAQCGDLPVRGPAQHRDHIPPHHREGKASGARHRLEPAFAPDQRQLHGLFAHRFQPGQHPAHKGVAPFGGGPVLGKAAAAQLAHHRVGQTLAGILGVGHLPVKVKAEPVLNGGVHGGGGAVPRAGVGLGKAVDLPPEGGPEQAHSSTSQPRAPASRLRARTPACMP